MNTNPSLAYQFSFNAMKDGHQIPFVPYHAKLSLDEFEGKVY